MEQSISSAHNFSVKSLLLFLILFSFNSFSGAQIHLPGTVNIPTSLAINPTDADASSKSVLDMVSTTKGFLAPRMTTTNRDAITSVPEALSIYNSSTHYPNFYNGTSWKQPVTSGDIVNADINSSAGIAYSKLSLTGQVVNADVAAAAAIAYSKLATLTSANILVGSAGGVATATAVTGDISLTNAGVTAYSGTVPTTKGGTGQTTYTDGQLLIGNSSGNGLTKATITAGSNITVTNGNGSISIAASGTAASAYNYTAQTSNYTAVINDWVVASGASFNVTLPTAGSQAGKSIIIQHNGTSLTQIYTLLTNSGQTINGPGGTVGSGVYTLVTNGEKLLLMSDGTNWQVVHHDTLTGWNNAGTFNISATAAFVISWTGNQSIVQGDTYTDGSGNVFTVTTTANTTSGTFSGVTNPAATGTLTRQTGTGVTPITWTSRTTTGQPVFGTNTNLVQWMRNGKNWTVRWILNQTVAGTGGSGDYIAYTPTGITLDTTVTPVYVLGPAAILLNNAPAFASIVTSMVAATQNSASTMGGAAIPYSTTSFRFTGGTTSANNIGSGNIALGGTTIGYNFSATFPGLGLQP